MNKRTRRSRHGKKRGHTRKHRGGGGCFGGICKPNKKMIQQVEQPGQRPNNKATVYENPLRQVQEAVEEESVNNARANAELQNAYNKMTPEERAAFNAEVNASFSALGNGSGTGLGPGSEVNRNVTPEEMAELEAMAEEELKKGTGNAELNKQLAEVNRISAILSRPLGQGKKKGRRTRKNHRGGGGCFGGICGPNQKMMVEQPGTLPATNATVTRVNPMSQMNASKTAASTRDDLLKRKGELQMSILEKQAMKSSYEQKGNQRMVAEMEKSIQTTKAMLRNILVMLQALEKAEKQAAIRKADPVAFAAMMTEKSAKAQRPVLGAKATGIISGLQGKRKNRKTRRAH